MLFARSCLLMILLIIGCMSPDRDPVAPGPASSGTDSIPKQPGDSAAHRPPDTSVIHRPVDTALTHRWTAAYPPGTPDSLLTGDFAPIGAGFTWVYHELSRSSAPPVAGEDTQWVARVEVSILAMRSSDSGRIIRIGFKSVPLYRHCSLVAHGKRWDWDEAPDDTAAKVWERQYLELGDGFLTQNPLGGWDAAREAYGPRYHRVPRSQMYVDSRMPAYDSLFQRIGMDRPNPVYARDAGMVEMDSTGATTGIVVKARLVAFRGRVLDDSLWRELQRPLVPKDPAMGMLSLDEIPATLPAGFCDLPGPAKIADATLALAEYTEIKAGNTWEYLGTNGSGNSPAWYAGQGQILQGLVRFSIPETRTQGACTLFSFAEKDSLFRGTASTTSGTTTGTRTVPGSFSASSGFGVKRGPDVFLWSMSGDSVHLDTLRAGLLKGKTLWPFASGKPLVALGDSTKVGSYLSSLRYRTTAVGSRLVYQIDFLLYNPDPWETHSKLIQGTGLVYADYLINQGQYVGQSQNTRELFAFNGQIVDPAVKARYDSLSVAP